MTNNADRRQQKHRRRMITIAGLASLILLAYVALISATNGDSQLGNTAAANAPRVAPTEIDLRPPSSQPNPTTASPTAAPSSSPTGIPTSQPTSEPTSPAPSPSSSPDSSYSSAAPDDPPIGGSSFPTMDSTGPRIPVASMQKSGTIKTEKDGQVVEGMNVTRMVKVTHDDVIVRDSRINHTATKSGGYALYIAQKDDDSCPENVVIEHIEIVGNTDILVDTAKSVYGRCPFTLRNSRIYDVGNGVQITNGARIEGNFILNNHFVPDSGSHRGGVALNGGSDNVIIGNTIACEGTGCSGGLVMYGDFSPVSNILIQENLINTTGSYCTYGGSLDSKEYPKGTHIRYIGNHFGRAYFPTCGRYGVRAGWNGSYEGNEWRDNVWHDTGEIIP